VPVDPVELRAALERQAALLVRAGDEVRPFAAVPPRVSEADWRGPARQACDTAQAELDAALRDAVELLDEAVRATRLAIAAVAP